MPAVYVKNGGVYASSRDVAAFFGKTHDNVLKAIDKIVGMLPGEGSINFNVAPYTHEKNNQTFRLSYRVYATGLGAAER